MKKKIEKTEKKLKEKTPFWAEMISIYFEFCKTHFGGEVPSFDGSAPRDLKSIVTTLKKRAESVKVEWSLKNASERLGAFLRAAYNHQDSSGDYWLREHWLLSNLNRQKDIIFFNAAKNKQNARREESVGATGQESKVEPTGSFGNL